MVLLQPQNLAPKFRGTAVVDGQFQEISSDLYSGKYLVLFFYPLDFTFVCPTEIIAYNEYAEEFRKNGCEVRQRESVRERMKERKRETV